LLAQLSRSLASDANKSGGNWGGVRIHGHGIVRRCRSILFLATNGAENSTVFLVLRQINKEEEHENGTERGARTHHEPRRRMTGWLAGSTRVLRMCMHCLSSLKQLDR